MLRNKPAKDFRCNCSVSTVVEHADYAKLVLEFFMRAIAAFMSAFVSLSENKLSKAR